MWLVCKKPSDNFMVLCFLLGGLSRPVGTGTNITTRAVCLSACLSVSVLMAP